jgi:hypothetical protein
LRLFRANDSGTSGIYYNRSTSTSTFPALARNFCSYQASGGRLLSFGSISTSVKALLPAVKALLVNASTTLILVGGYQTPTRPGSAATPQKSRGWNWTDPYTNSAVLAGGNWATADGQPE